LQSACQSRASDRLPLRVVKPYTGAALDKAASAPAGRGAGARPETEARHGVCV